MSGIGCTICAGYWRKRGRVVIREALVRGMFASLAGFDALMLRYLAGVHARHLRGESLEAGS